MPFSIHVFLGECLLLYTAVKPQSWRCNISLAGHILPFSWKWWLIYLRCETPAGSRENFLEATETKKHLEVTKLSCSNYVPTIKRQYVENKPTVQEENDSRGNGQIQGDRGSCAVLYLSCWSRGSKPHSCISSASMGYFVMQQTVATHQYLVSPFTGWLFISCHQTLQILTSESFRLCTSRALLVLLTIVPPELGRVPDP